MYLYFQAAWFGCNPRQENVAQSEEPIDVFKWVLYFSMNSLLPIWNLLIFSFVSLALIDIITSIWCNWSGYWFSTWNINLSIAKGTVDPRVVYLHQSSCFWIISQDYQNSASKYWPKFSLKILTKLLLQHLHQIWAILSLPILPLKTID